MTMRDFPVLKTERLTLRAFRQDDLDRICEYLNDFDITKMLVPVPYPYTREDAQFWIDLTTNSDGSDNINWAIDDGSGIIGCIGSFELQSGTTFGYWLGKPYWGKGYVSEAGRAVREYLFAHYDFPVLRCGAFVENPGSQNVLKKLGFLEVGRNELSSAARGNQLVPNIKFELPRSRYLAEILDSLPA
ncbi:N-acetyltransferase [Rhodobacteraceae bacterium RKSG542]|uniref:GNAT family N-acetyltransferase n=1 Tax=Pseudovibrio flavus TaxID=2529854 RepID=UPI0012BC341D|nr:GNAT family N-acetyltransferase [Pseudovibrio flavus]MTI17759.1 N-acetyltransferase [Pseudovibrio flavus]